MGIITLFQNMWISYKTFFRLFWLTFFKSRRTQARLTVKRFLIMSGFFPVLFVVQTMHWIGFFLDEIFFPKYKSVEIRSPVFIVGVPRSGTTFLHRVLAHDTERFATMTLWELILAPSVTERKFWLVLARLDGWMGAPLAGIIKWVEGHAFKSFDSIHRISLSDPEEDYFLLVPVYACMILVLPFPFFEELGYLAFFDDAANEKDKDRIMTFYRSCLQRHLYVRGTGKTFFSKNVAFSPMIGSLVRHFPDCRIIGTVRNPMDAVPSHISSMTAGAEVFDNDTGGEEFRDQLMEIQGYAYAHIPDRLSRLPESRHMIVKMEDLQETLQQVVHSIYEQFGFRMSPAFKAFIQSRDERQRRYKSGHKYDLASCGLTAEMIYNRFSHAFERFSYPPPFDTGAQIRKQ
ncbi:MAG: sulfotransferase [Desulfarculaceae bacterium]|nr:sulfotransferase [Desulfarculaceae bacterium]